MKKDARGAVEGHWDTVRSRWYLVKKAEQLRFHQLSNAAVTTYSSISRSKVIFSRFGLQQTWQSSTYCCAEPPPSSTLMSFHSPQPAHWKPASTGTRYRQRSPFWTWHRSAPGSS